MKSNRVYFFCFFSVSWFFISLLLIIFDKFFREERFIDWNIALIALLAITRSLSLAFYTNKDFLVLNMLYGKKILIRSFVVAIFDLSITIFIPLALVFLSERLSDRLSESFEMVFVVILFITILHGPLYLDRLLMYKLIGHSSDIDSF